MGSGDNMLKYIGREWCNNCQVYCGMLECEKGHRMKYCEHEGKEPKECIICLHIEQLKAEEVSSGNY